MTSSLLVLLLQAPFPDGFSTYAEAVVAWDGVRLGGLLQRHLSLSLGAEVFGWGRVDVDGRLAAQFANRNLEVALSGLALGLGEPGARHLYSGSFSSGWPGTSSWRPRWGGCPGPVRSWRRGA